MHADENVSRHESRDAHRKDGLAGVLFLISTVVHRLAQGAERWKLDFEGNVGKCGGILYGLDSYENGVSSFRRTYSSVQD